MATYRVIKPGFHEGKMYDPEGKRKTLTVAKAFKHTPSWLELMKEPTAAEKKAAERAAKAEAKAAEKKAEEDKIETDAVNFTESPKSSQVETL